MGAKDDKKKTAEPLSKEELESLLGVGVSVNTAIAKLDDSEIETRELAIVLTKLEEAEMWLDRAFEEMGYEPADEEETEEEGEPEEDEQEEGDEEE